MLERLYPMASLLKTPAQVEMALAILMSALAALLPKVLVMVTAATVVKVSQE